MLKTVAIGGCFHKCLPDSESEKPLMQAVRRTAKRGEKGSWRFYLRTGILLLIVISVFIGIRSIGVERLQAIVDRAGVFGPVIYVGLRATASVLAPFSGGPLQLASGVLFGFVPAVIYSVIGSTLGYSISFWIARRYGRSVVKRLVGENIEQVEAYINRLNGLWNLIVARLALYFAYDFVAYAAGLSKVRFFRFAVVSALVGIPPIATTIFIGLAASGELPF